LDQRRAVARDIRNHSEQRKHSSSGYADVDAEAACAWMTRTKAPILIHGHTHRPGQHALGDRLERWVLSDWDCLAAPPRAEVLRLQRQPGDELVSARRMSPNDADL